MNARQQPDPRKSHWEQVYQTKAADSVSWFQAHAEQSLALIRGIAAGRQGLQLIDVGAGASTLVDDLLAAPEGFGLSVLDISRTALELAAARLDKAAGRVEWIEGDITQVALPERRWDIWHDRAVFHFLTEAAQREAYVERVRRAVRPGGHVIVAAFAPDGPEQCSGLPVMRYAPGELHAQFGGEFELLQHLSESHRTPSGAIQHFVYCHCLLH